MDAPRSVLKKNSIQQQQHEERRVSFAPLPPASANQQTTNDGTSRKRENGKSQVELQRTTSKQNLLNSKSTNAQGQTVLEKKKESSPLKRFRTTDLLESALELSSSQLDLEHAAVELTAKVSEKHETEKASANRLIAATAEQVDITEHLSVLESSLSSFGTQKLDQSLAERVSAARKELEESKTLAERLHEKLKYSKLLMDKVDIESFVGDSPEDERRFESRLPCERELPATPFAALLRPLLGPEPKPIQLVGCTRPELKSKSQVSFFEPAITHYTLSNGVVELKKAAFELPTAWKRKISHDSVLEVSKVGYELDLKLESETWPRRELTPEHMQLRLLCVVFAKRLLIKVDECVVAVAPAERRQAQQEI
ncbi:unnamed protein product [Caenorhabditis auriculariae]|uniref:Uncharacterized protein n=1 Tax=Caenorhabditis auriculariae TaxID=2777116 RepID=A0A8S1GZ01_9PELO|nr:unnamed protein product [Caenorhabditis auriculariae]